MWMVSCLAMKRFFGLKKLSDIDTKNISEGKESSVERTKRLFYVGCTRAKESLAIVLYAENPEMAKKTILERNDWFEENRDNCVAGLTDMNENKPSWIEEKTGRAVHGEDDARNVIKDTV